MFNKKINGKRALHLLIVSFLLLVNAGLSSADVWVNSEDYGTLSAAVAAAAGETLVIPRAETLNQNITVPSGTHLMFMEGGSIAKASTYTLTIEGAVTAPIMQIFSGFSPGDVTFSISQAVEQVYPQWWGAKADGLTNDRDAIQCAIDSGCTWVHLPGGNYLLNSPLNVTSLGWFTKLMLTGNGGPADGEGTNLIGNTGGVVIDATGSRHLDFRNFSIVSGDTTPSTVGILYARATGTGQFELEFSFTEFNNLMNVGVHLNSIPAANGGNGTVAVYNLAAELWRAQNVCLEADTGIAFTGYNAYGILSPFQTLSSIPSMSVCTIDGASTIRSRKGPCVVIDNGIRIELLNVYFCGDDSVVDPYEYAVKIIGGGMWPSGITITGHKDRPGGWLYANDVVLQNLQLKGTGQGDGTSVHLANATLIDGNISVAPAASEPAVALLNAPGSGGAIKNVTMQLYDNQSVTAPLRVFAGNIIRTTQTMTVAAGSVTVGPSAAYMLMASDGIATVSPVEP